GRRQPSPAGFLLNTAGTAHRRSAPGVARTATGPTFPGCVVCCITRWLLYPALYRPPEVHAALRLLERNSLPGWHWRTVGGQVSRKNRYRPFLTVISKPPGLEG